MCLSNLVWSSPYDNEKLRELTMRWHALGSDVRWWLR
jgi:hypothetical protein